MENAYIRPRILRLDISNLTTHSPSNSNRDDTGMPKHQLFGGYVRGKRSSQSIKAARRRYVEEAFANEDRSVRTKHAAYAIADAIQERIDDIDRDEALAYAAGVMQSIGIVKVKTIKQDFGKLFAFDEEESAYDTGALQFVPNKLISALADFACHLREREDVPVTLETKTVGPKSKQFDVLFANVPKKLPEDLKIERESCIGICGVTPALFGAMNAQNPSFNVDATCQVASDLGVTPFTIETDYYSAKDDISMFDHSGAAMIGTQAFASMVSYGYTTLDITHLYEALGNKEMTLHAIRAYVESIFFAAPTGKQNTYANRNLPSMVYGRLHYDAPMSLAGAFEQVIIPDSEHSITGQACRRMTDYVKSMDTAYGFEPVLQRVVVATPEANPAKKLCPEGVVDVRTFINDLIGAIDDLLEA